MPAKNTADIAHAAITDHRILRRPPEAPDAPGEARKIVAWREPPAGVRDRDIGLAEVVVGFSKKLPEIGGAGFQTLQRLPADQQNQDPAILAALAGLALQRQNTAEALQLERNAAGLQPRSAKAALNLGIVLRRSGNLTEAQQQFERAAGLDPSLKEAFIELAMFYADQRRADEVRATVDRYLQWNPQDIMFRLQKAHLAAGVP